MPPPKRGEIHPVSEQRDIPLKKWQILKRLNSKPPSNVLQKFNIYVSILFTLITGSLAVLAYNAAVSIEGMNQVLKTFKANVRVTPKRVYIHKDTIFVQTVIKNYGTRIASQISSFSYFISDNYIYNVPVSSVQGDILPSENYFYDFHFLRTKEVSDKEVAKFIIASKVVFFDPTTSEYDSTYSFSSNLYYSLDSVKVVICNQEEVLSAREKIKDRFPDNKF